MCILTSNINSLEEAGFVLVKNGLIPVHAVVVKLKEWRRGELLHQNCLPRENSLHV